MNALNSIRERLQKLPNLKGFEFGESKESSLYATQDAEYLNFRDENKDEISMLTGFYGLFVAHMYKGQPEKEFFYLTLSRKASRRPFRKQRSFEFEYNKVFASGKDIDKLIEDFESKNWRA